MSDVRRVMLGTGAAVTLLALYAVATRVPPLTRYFFNDQDRWVVATLVGVLVTSALSTRRLVITGVFPKSTLDWRTVLAVSLGIALLLWAGTYILLDNYPLTRDEHMVVFDMAVFRRGHLSWPLDPAWRPYLHALTPAFVLPLPGNGAWVSVYMPVNAMMRTAFGAILDPALMNPLLAAVGAVALFDVAPRLFPQNGGAQAIALLLYGTSAQVMVTAMTTYAMTAHLALNLIWLALFMRGTRITHAGAMIVGFLAIGLHQIVFHPLFALPFMDYLRRRGEWRTIAFYGLGYALSGLFWMSYPGLVAASGGLASTAAPAAASGGFIAERILPLLRAPGPLTLPLMTLNLLRFVAWENLALVPLMALSFGAFRRNEGVARPLADGIVLTIIAMAILLPYQGHGWGYRYLHGLIGSCALLAAYGWLDFAEREEVRTFVAVASALTLAISLPFLLWRAHAFIDPYARMDRAIDRTHADMVVIQTEGASFWVDEVRNRPDLGNRPLRLASEALAPADIRTLCARGTIAFVDPTNADAPGVAFGQVPDPRHFDALKRAATQSCAPREAQSR